LRRNCGRRPLPVERGRTRSPHYLMAMPPAEGWFWKGCKPNSVFPESLRRRESFVSAAIPGTRLVAQPRSGPLRGPLFGLAPDGVFRAASLALRAVGSYPTFSPLPVPLPARAVCSLWHCPSSGLVTTLPRVSQSNGLELRGIAPCGVRTFLPRLAPEAILHPPKTTLPYPAPLNGTMAIETEVRTAENQMSSAYRISGATMKVSQHAALAGGYANSHLELRAYLRTLKIETRGIPDAIPAVDFEAHFASVSALNCSD
jgi:hypothetical protein